MQPRVLSCCSCFIVSLFYVTPNSIPPSSHIDLPSIDLPFSAVLCQSYMRCLIEPVLLALLELERQSKRETQYGITRIEPYKEISANEAAQAWNPT